MFTSIIHSQSGAAEQGWQASPSGSWNLRGLVPVGNGGFPFQDWGCELCGGEMGWIRMQEYSGINFQVLRKAQSIWASVGSPPSKSGPCLLDALCSGDECAVCMSRGSVGSPQSFTTARLLASCASNGRQEIQVQNPSLPLIGCMALGKSCSLSWPQFLYLLNEAAVPDDSQNPSNSDTLGCFPIVINGVWSGPDHA